MKFDTKFNINEKVYIIPFKREGRIKAFYANDNAIQYYVRYFDEADIKEIYFYEGELKRIKETDEKLGFRKDGS